MIPGLEVASVVHTNSIRCQCVMMVLSQQLNNCCLQLLPTGSFLISQILSRSCPTSNLLSPPPIALVYLLLSRWSPRWHCAGGFSLYALPSLFSPRWLLPHCHADCGTLLFKAGIAEGSVSSSQNPRRNNLWGLERRVHPLPPNQVRNRTCRRRGCLGPRLSCPNCC